MNSHQANTKVNKTVATREKLETMASQAKSKRKENKQFLKKIKKKKSIPLDQHVNALHEEVFFTTIDCTECANCCKTLGPRLTNKDIDHIAKHLNLKPQQVMEEYLKTDEDQDIVFNALPCPFLVDNRCSIYEARPKACRDYPHTQQPHQAKITKLTLNNAETCPAVFEILERLKEQFTSL